MFMQTLAVHRVMKTVWETCNGKETYAYQGETAEKAQAMYQTILDGIKAKAADRPSIYMVGQCTEV